MRLAATDGRPDELARSGWALVSFAALYAPGRAIRPRTRGPSSGPPPRLAGPGRRWPVTTPKRSTGRSTPGGPPARLGRARALGARAIAEVRPRTVFADALVPDSVAATVALGGAGWGESRLAGVIVVAEATTPLPPEAACGL